MVWDCFLRLCLGCEFLAAALWGCSWHCCDAHPGSVVCESSTEEPQLCTGEAPPPQSYCCTPQSDSDSDHRWRVPEFPPSDYGCALKPAMKSQLHLMLRRGVSRVLLGELKAGGVFSCSDNVHKYTWIMRDGAG